MNDELPFGVKWARVVNFISIIISILVGLCLVAIAIPNFFQAAEQAGAKPNGIIVFLVGFVFFLIGLVPALLILKLNKALARLNPTA